MFDKRHSTVPLLLALALTLACSSGGESEGPGGTVQLFYQHLNDGKYNDAKEMYNAEARATLDDPELSSDAGFRTWANTQTKERSISEVEILESATDDTGATIDYEIRYEDGTVKKSRVKLTEESGEWKLGFSLDL
jgi:hypothetical protein